MLGRVGQKKIGLANCELWQFWNFIAVAGTPSGNLQPVDKFSWVRQILLKILLKLLKLLKILKLLSQTLSKSQTTQLEISELRHLWISCCCCSWVLATSQRALAKCAQNPTPRIGLSVRIWTFVFQMMILVFCMVTLGIAHNSWTDDPLEARKISVELPWKGEPSDKVVFRWP